MEAIVNGDNVQSAEILENYGMLYHFKDIVNPKIPKKKLVENIAELYRNFLSETEAIFNSTHNLIISIDLAGG